VQNFNPNAGQKIVWTKFCPSLEKAQKHLNYLFINVLHHFANLGTRRDKEPAVSNKIKPK